MAAGRQVETPASAHQGALWAAVAGSSRQQNSVLSHLLEQFSSSQQTTDGRRQRTGDLGTASKKKAKKTVPEQSVHSRLLEHTHQAALIHAVAVVGLSQDFLHFPPASPAFCFIRWGSYCVTVEAAALFSDQTIIFADACCAKICQNQITTRKKTCQIKAADMISYNQHRKKWQRGCPCNLLINIFDKVSHYLIKLINIKCINSYLYARGWVIIIWTGLNIKIGIAQKVYELCLFWYLAQSK